jgi:hypothetical protein
VAYRRDWQRIEGIGDYVVRMADFGCQRSLKPCARSPPNRWCMRPTGDRRPDGSQLSVGATIVAGDVNLSGFLRQARRVELSLLDDGGVPIRVSGTLSFLVSGQDWSMPIGSGGHLFRSTASVSWSRSVLASQACEAARIGVERDGLPAVGGQHLLLNTGTLSWIIIETDPL